MRLISMVRDGPLRSRDTKNCEPGDTQSVSSHAWVEVIEVSAISAFQRRCSLSATCLHLELTLRNVHGASHGPCFKCTALPCSEKTNMSAKISAGRGTDFSRSTLLNV